MGRKKKIKKIKKSKKIKKGEESPALKKSSGQYAYKTNDEKVQINKIKKQPT